MFELNSIYRPITAAPFKNSKTYCEIEPCDALKPYIRCFWGTPVSLQVDNNTMFESSLVIPDTCMDIIFHINYTENKYSGYFCSIDESAYKSSDKKCTAMVSTFAIRFYAWSAVLFAENSLKNSKNNCYDINDYFIKLRRELEPILFDVKTLTDKIKITEKILLKRLNLKLQNNNLLNSLYYIISSNGTIKTSELSMLTAVSSKQLERIFNENIGTTPKSLSSLIRYQLLWQDMIYNRNFNIHDAVDKYGYFDQAHLINDFKRRHLTSPIEALKIVHKK